MSTTVNDTRTAPKRDTMWSWISLVLRLVLAGVFLYAGVPKLGNLDSARRSVRAYELFSYDIANLIGTMQPILEVILGVLLLLGLFTRLCAIVSAVLLVVFIAGIASAWARGINIDCGCFSQGGTVAANQTKYPQDIARDVVFLLMAGIVIWRPRSKASLDHVLWG